MKLRNLPLRFAGLMVLALSGAVSAQTEAALRIAGAVGSVYSVQYTTNDSQPDSWRCREFLRLTNSLCLWADHSASPGEKRLYRAVAETHPSMLFFTPGTFKMGTATQQVGAPWINRLTLVTLTRGFWLATNHVTQNEYLAVMHTNPASSTGDLSQPVDRATWSDATNYCALLTQHELACGKIPRGCEYRLPTEAEWEYANQAWTQLGSGNDSALAGVTNYAWFIIHNAGNASAAQGLPSPSGLCAMRGSVADWCLDGYGAYPGGSLIDPQGAKNDSIRVKCGGTAMGCCGSSPRRVGVVLPSGIINDGLRVVLAVRRELPGKNEQDTKQN